MNDPFECLVQVERQFSSKKIDEFRDYASNFDIESFKILCQMDDIHFTKALNHFRKQMISRWAFCSLSKKFDDILMWSYYANGHEGIVVGFDFKKQKDRRIFQKVDYKDSLEELDPKIYVDFMRGELLLHKFVKDISIKAKCWQREQEWRIWRSEPGYYTYSQKEVKAVYFGINCKPETEHQVRDLLRYVTHGDFASFKMVFKDKPIKLSATFW